MCLFSSAILELITPSVGADAGAVGKLVYIFGGGQCDYSAALNFFFNDHDQRGHYARLCCHKQRQVVELRTSGLDSCVDAL